MNLLVTNTFSPQAYDIIRALRPHANKIVATMEGESRFGARLGHAANSRLVDKRRYTPSPVRDWQAGRVMRENTEREEAFIRAIERICADEKIDLVFPSWDPHVYVLSKNRARLARAGVVVPVPEYEVVLTALDKYRTIRAAQEVGFPCPRTYLYDPELDLKAVAEREGFPLVIKPRFTSGGRGMAIVKDYDELTKTLPGIVAAHNAPLIQEYIPGRRRDSVQFVVGMDGELKFAFHKKRRRQFRVTARFAAVSESSRPDEFLPDARKLVAKVGWWGAMGIELIHDPRSGVYKLLEINPRFPRQLWNRIGLGVNEPLMCVRIAREEPVEPVEDYPAGVLFVSPVEDFQLLTLQLLDTLAYRFRTGVMKQSSIDSLNPPLSIAKQIKSFMRTYRGDERKVFDSNFKYFFQDPLVSVLWWLRLTTWVAGGVKHIGK